MHWCVVAALVGISAIAYANDGPLWIRIILSLITFAMLIRNSSFSMTTAFYPAQQKICTQHRKLFGVKQRTVHFSAVSKVDFEIEHWGRYRRSPRANLTLWTLDEDMDDDLIEVFTLANPDEGKIAADRITQILAPYLAHPVPENALMPAWFGDGTHALLAQLCRDHSSETSFFVAAADLDEARKETVYREMALPEDEQIIAFLDLTEERKGKRGLVIAHGGLYWKNTFFTASKSAWVGWDPFIDTTVRTDPNDADVWIDPSMQIGLGDAARQAPVYGLLVEVQRALRDQRDQQT